MATQAVDRMPSGWPLGLESLNLRLRVMETFNIAADDPGSFNLGSVSFSSLSSSDLDTQSTRSFFRDNSSVTLGRLIGIIPGYGELYFNQQRDPQEASSTSHRGEKNLCMSLCCVSW